MQQRQASKARERCRARSRYSDRKSFKGCVKSFGPLTLCVFTDQQPTLLYPDRVSSQSKPSRCISVLIFRRRRERELVYRLLRGLRGRFENDSDVSRLSRQAGRGRARKKSLWSRQNRRELCTESTAFLHCNKMTTRTFCCAPNRFDAFFSNITSTNLHVMACHVSVRSSELNQYAIMSPRFPL